MATNDEKPTGRAELERVLRATISNTSSRTIRLRAALGLAVLDGDDSDGLQYSTATEIRRIINGDGGE